MKQSYSERFERSVAQREAVDKILNKKEIKQNLYIKNRQQALVETKKFVSKED